MQRSLVVLVARTDALQFDDLESQLIPPLIQTPDVILQMTQLQPPVRHLLRQFLTLLCQDLLPPLDIFLFLRRLLLGSPTLFVPFFDTLIGDGIGLRPRLPRDQYQNDDQRPHRADQHGEEWEELHADIGFADALPSHAARPLDRVSRSSTCEALDAGPPNRVVSR